MSFYPPVCYEIFVRSFCDSNGDGIGDLNGITSRLDYLYDLGIRGIWLTPIQPSPSYHKYDVTDYYGIDPEYGTLADFELLLVKAHSLGIHVYTDLVIHHTSVLHPWFLDAKGNPASPYRQYYRWMSTEEISNMGLEVRELTQDAHTINPWHKIKGDRERFLGVFSDEMADLNFENPELTSEIYNVADFWLNKVGVDGFRLDAARHIYPIWEDDRNPGFWKGFAERIEQIRPGAFLVGEVWAETHHVAPFFQGLKANFNFDLWLRIEGMLTREANEDFVPWLEAQRQVFESVSEDYIDATMLSNHDQQRIGSTVGGNVAKMKLAAAILLTLPGQPYLYYGEEIGMLGKKPDPFLREPFLWGDQKIETSWKEPRYSKRGKVRSLYESQRDPFSLYYCYKNLIGLRNRYKVLGAVAGTSIQSVAISETWLLAYCRPGSDYSFLVLHNLSKLSRQIALPEELESFSLIRYITGAHSSKEGSEIRLGGYHTMILQSRS